MYAMISSSDLSRNWPASTCQMLRGATKRLVRQRGLNWVRVHIHMLLFMIFLS